MCGEHSRRYPTFRRASPLLLRITTAAAETTARTPPMVEVADSALWRAQAFAKPQQIHGVPTLPRAMMDFRPLHVEEAGTTKTKTAVAPITVPVR